MTTSGLELMQPSYLCLCLLDSMTDSEVSGLEHDCSGKPDLAYRLTGYFLFMVDSGIHMNQHVPPPSPRCTWRVHVLSVQAISFRDGPSKRLRHSRIGYLSPLGVWSSQHHVARCSRCTVDLGSLGFCRCFSEDKVSISTKGITTGLFK